MGIKISGETETRLASEAQRLGMSVAALLKRRIERETLTGWTQPPPSLPVWHLGSVGALHRRELYPSQAGSAQ